MKKDSFIIGLLIALGSELAVALLLCGVYILFGIPFPGNMKIFALSGILPVLLLRYYVKNLQYISTAKGIVAGLVFTLMPFIIIMVRMGEIGMS
jgi:hypothetical protein